MKLSTLTWLLPVVCALVLAGSSRAQDDQGIPAPPPPDQTEEPAPDVSQAQEPPSAPGQDQDQSQDQGASFQTFYDDLSSQGTWIQSSDYGYVWQPDVNDPNWAPYTEGNWAYSDEGWTWVSNEPWGWATYHYGRWVNLAGTGWCWVPGYTWAPAWVSWRYGDGYCGWAPLPPDSFVGIDYFAGTADISMGYHIGGDCDFFFGIGPECYCFMPVAYLGYGNYHGYYAPRANNFAIINHTTNVTNIIVSHHGTAGGAAFGNVSVGGPSLAQVNAVSETPVASVNLVASNQFGGGMVSGHALALFAPVVSPGTRTMSQPEHIIGMIGHAEINRGTDVMQPLVVNRQLSPIQPTPAQVQQATQAQLKTPARAKVVTTHTVIQPVFSGPLTSLHTLPGMNSAAHPGASFSPQPSASWQQGGSIAYPHQGQGHPAPSYQPGIIYHSPQPSATPGHATSNQTSSNGAPSRPGNYYHDGGPSGGYRNGGAAPANSGGGYRGGPNSGNGAQGH
ncbi:MAG TPA: DUF6600 domain-containing protein [Candidatus Methylacidiphilales bacterium]|nr:DUF6600 domain-containing protein [Candidatus Methylacidiphilales bacterium]